MRTTNERSEKHGGNKRRITRFQEDLVSCRPLPLMVACGIDWSTMGSSRMWTEPGKQHVNEPCSLSTSPLPVRCAVLSRSKCLEIQASARHQRHLFCAPQVRTFQERSAA